jgi:HK97 family phage portal protein
MRGLGALVHRALTPAPFSGVPYSQGTGINQTGTVAGYVPPEYWGRSAQLVAAPDLPAMAFGGTGESSTISISAAWRCLHIISNGIAALEIYAFDDSEQDERVRTPRVLADPWPAVTPVEWRAMVVSSLLLHGNAYLLPYDEDPRTGYPRQLPIVHPERMTVEMGSDGLPRYFLDQNRINPLDVLHIRGYLPPGSTTGIGIVEAQRRGIRLALDIDKHQLGQLESASVPPVTIKVNRPEISDTQAMDIQTRWMARHGLGNRAPAVIPTSIDVQPIGWTPQDTQFLESKQFMAAEICWWFGIDPRLLGLSAGGQSLTYSNIETTYVDLQRMSFLPWTSRIESALSRVLPRSQAARFDFSPILRTTLQDRYAAYAIGVEGGWLTVDEVRVFENMGPLGGDPHAGRRGGGTAETLREKVNPSLPITEVA